MNDKQFKTLAGLMGQQYNRFMERVDKLEQKVDLRADGVFTKMDAVYKEVLAVRQEQVMHVGSHQRIDEELDYIRNKIKKLESKKSAVV